MSTILVHLAAGIGNIVLATPLLVALEELGYTAHVWLDADYPDGAELLEGWSAVASVARRPPADLANYDQVIPAAPPFYWSRYAAVYRRYSRWIERPPDSLFYENEQAYYLHFARCLGYPADRHPVCRLPIAPDERWGVTARTVVLAPGCKTGEMAAKRWPFFAELSARFEDAAVVGTADDLQMGGGAMLAFPRHVRSFAGRLRLRETAEVIASAGVMIGNDSGLSHIAAAVGTPTVMLFGPSPDRELGPMPPHVRVLRAGLPCEPCWLRARFADCEARIDCLRRLDVDQVEREIRRLL